MPFAVFRCHIVFYKIYLPFSPFFLCDISKKLDVKSLDILLLIVYNIR